MGTHSANCNVEVTLDRSVELQSSTREHRRPSAKFHFNYWTICIPPAFKSTQVFKEQGVVDQVHECHLEEGNTAVTTLQSIKTRLIFLLSPSSSSSTFRKNGGWPQCIMQMRNFILRFHATTLQITSWGPWSLLERCNSLQETVGGGPDCSWSFRFTCSDWLNNCAHQIPIPDLHALFS